MSVRLVKENFLYLQEINVSISEEKFQIYEYCLSCLSHLSPLQMYSSKEWCQFLMGIWVWLRSVNVWSTLFLSAFHLQTLRRVAPTVGNLHGSRGAPKTLLLSLVLIWVVNFIYSIPAHIFSINGNVNSTEVRVCCSRRLY